MLYEFNIQKFSTVWVWLWVSGLIGSNITTHQHLSQILIQMFLDPDWWTEVCDIILS